MAKNFAGRNFVKESAQRDFHGWGAVCFGWHERYRKEQAACYSVSNCYLSVVNIIFC